VYNFDNGDKLSAGTIGNIGTTSFFPSKNLGCYGDGGAIFTNDDDLAIKIRMICNHGQQKQYIHNIVGVNSRLDSIQAAILLVKLKHLRTYELARKKVATQYDGIFNANNYIEIPFRDLKSTHVFHQYTIKLNAEIRDKVKDKLLLKGIPSVVYYPIPLHLQEAYRVYNYKKGDFPVSEKLCNTVLSIPIHTEMDENMVNYIGLSVVEAL
jgi:UDP-2-acetamido-2-deoxy-ribo-hexuluronate aminotransferase